MVQVQSSWFPLVARKPQTFVPALAVNESDYQRATQLVYRSRDLSSRLEARMLR